MFSYKRFPVKTLKDKNNNKIISKGKNIQKHP